jgi:tRNA guanosine-2'-O-methyltransferase
VLIDRLAVEASVSATSDEPAKGLTAAVAAGLAPASALRDARLAWPYGNFEPFDDDFFGVGCGASGQQPARALGLVDAQRKLARVGERETASSAAAAVLTCSGLSPIGAPRAHQPLIVFASLVDKAPNLGGLARTAEIFGAESLVVADRSVLKDNLFSFTSLDAERLLPVHACPLAGARDYLRARRAEGWAVVALEQADRALVLGHGCALPERMVLLLGAEKEGVPPELLAEADVTVEIPQLGTLRSLNVHVSAALVVWEWTRQRLENAARNAGSLSAAP